MAEQFTITQDIASSITAGQAVYDVVGEKIGTVDDFDCKTGWLKAAINPVSDKALYIPFKLITNIDPKELFLSRTKDEIDHECSNPPATIQVKNLGDTPIATTSQASGYGDGPVVVETTNLHEVSKHFREGYFVITADQVSLGTITRYDLVTGWILIGKNPPFSNYDLVIPLTVVDHVYPDFGEVHLSVSQSDLRGMTHLEPVDVVFADAKPTTAG